MAELNSTIIKGKLSVTEDINVNGSIKQNGTSLATVAISGNYNDLSNKPSIPSVSNATITIKQTGISDQSFTLNGNATTISLADNNTWRPLGTTADTACAGNDSRLSDSRPANGGNADTVDGEHASAFAHIGTANDLMQYGNEFNFVTSGYTGDVYLNYRTVGGTNGNITAYQLGNGAGGTLGTIIHSGNIGSQSVSSATTASKLGTNAGSATNPVYFTDGVPTACSYSLNKTVPSDAVFTDHTYNFAGTTFNSGDNATAEHNANNAWQNGHYYYTSNGPSGLGEESTDGALYVQNYSSDWVAQIAQDYRSGKMFVRSKKNGTWQSWKRIAQTDELGTQVTYSYSNGVLTITPK